MTRRGKPTVSVFAALQVLLFGTTAPQTMLLARAQDGSYTGEQIFYSSLTTSGELSTNCSLAVEACTEDAACAECVASISADRFRSRRLYNDAETSYGESEVGKVILRHPMIHLTTSIVVLYFMLRAGGRRRVSPLPCKRHSGGWLIVIFLLFLSSPRHGLTPLSKSARSVQPSTHGNTK